MCVPVPPCDCGRGAGEHVEPPTDVFSLGALMEPVRKGNQRREGGMDGRTDGWSKNKPEKGLEMWSISHHISFMSVRWVSELNVQYIVTFCIGKIQA